MDFDKVLDALATYGDKSFPDAAFIVEKGAEKDDKGKTLQKFRHLPHHKKSVTSATDNGSIDVPHLRNALARVNQVKPVKEGATAYRKRAKSHLQTHARVVLKNYKSKGSLTSELQEFVNFCVSVGITGEGE